MKLDLKEHPRPFTVGKDGKICIRDMGDIALESDEQLTFVTENTCRFDVVRKNWGFYATPSVNHRLKNEGFKTALVRNEQGRLYVMVVEKSQLMLFEEYCRSEKQTVLNWLDEYTVAQ